jgi:hypothetical protein
MQNVPFTITDALGYVAAGLIVMVAATIAVVGELPTEVSLVTGIGIGVAAYVVGHCISGVSTWVLDRMLFNDSWGLGRPEKVLLGDRRGKGAPKLWRTLFGNYYSPLPQPIEDRVKEKAKAEGLDEDDPATLLTHCESVVQGNQSYGSRVDRYEMLTTFLRNSALAFFLGAAILLVAPASSYIEVEAARGGPVVLNAKLLALLAILGAGLLFYRYVNMFLMWRREIFRLYAETGADA